MLLRPFSKWALFAFATNFLPVKKPTAGRATAGYQAATSFRCVSDRGRAKFDGRLADGSPRAISSANLPRLTCRKGSARR